MPRGINPFTIQPFYSPMSKRAYNFPEDFKGWQYMNQTPKGYHLYFSPDNRLAAMLDTDHKTVLIIGDRKTGVPIYENHDAIKESATHNFPRTSLDTVFWPAKIEFRPVVRKLP